MLRTVQGIILRTVKYSETSIICDAYTLELGLRTYIISGVRKKNSRISPALVRPMSLVEMVVYHKEDKDICRIKEIKAAYLFQQIPFDITKGTIGLFITEVAQKSIKEVTENEELFQFLNQSYQQLDQTSLPVANFPAWFLVHFAYFLGISPSLGELSDEALLDYAEGVVLEEAPEHLYFFSEENTQLLAGLQALEYEAAAQIPLSGSSRSNFLDSMLKFYRYHIHNFGELNSLVVLRALFE